MGRPISWPELDGLSQSQIKREMDDYSAGSEAKPLSANFERAGLSLTSLSLVSVQMELEDAIDCRDYSNGHVALRADDLRLLVPDKPQAQVVDHGSGGSHSRPMRTKIVRGLSDDCQLIEVCDERHDIAVLVWADVVASPNNAPSRREVLHSAGQTVQRHVISQTVLGESLPMRQVADASEASYETIEVDSLPDRPLTLSDLRLELGIAETRIRSQFACQLEAVIRAIEMAVAMQIDLPFEIRQYAGIR